MGGSDRAPCCLGHGISELCNGEWMWGKVTTMGKMSLKLVCFFLCALTAPDRTGKWLKYLLLTCLKTKGLWEIGSLTPWVQHASTKLKPKRWGHMILNFNPLSQINSRISKWKRQSIDSMFCMSILKSEGEFQMEEINLPKLRLFFCCSVRGGVFLFQCWTLWALGMPCLWNGCRVREELYKVLINSSRMFTEALLYSGGRLCNL